MITFRSFRKPKPGKRPELIQKTIQLREIAKIPNRVIFNNMMMPMTPVISPWWFESLEQMDSEFTSLQDNKDFTDLTNELDEISEQTMWNTQEIVLPLEGIDLKAIKPKYMVSIVFKAYRGKRAQIMDEFRKTRESMDVKPAVAWNLTQDMDLINIRIPIISLSEIQTWETLSHDNRIVDLASSMNRYIMPIIHY